MKKFKSMTDLYKPKGSAAVEACLQRNKKRQQASGNNMEWVCEAKNICRWKNTASNAQLEDCIALAENGAGGDEKKFAFFDKASKQAEMLSKKVQAEWKQLALDSKNLKEQASKASAQANAARLELLTEQCR